jgi:hypothetical protein
MAPNQRLINECLRSEVALVLIPTSIPLFNSAASKGAFGKRRDGTGSETLWPRPFYPPSRMSNRILFYRDRLLRMHRLHQLSSVCEYRD